MMINCIQLICLDDLSSKKIYKTRAIMVCVHVEIMNKSSFIYLL